MIVKKYPNRRLYDTERSKYINLEELTELVRDGEEVQIVDANTDEDLTREVYLQIVLEVLKGRDFLPTGVLRRVIRATGKDPVQRMLHDHLATAFTVLATQLDQIEGLFRTAPKPPRASRAAPPEPEPPKAKAAKAEADDELSALRSRLDQLEARLGRKR
jgi:polyhydroxyalkanoate synthesis repressor PhaR